MKKAPILATVLLAAVWVGDSVMAAQIERTVSTTLRAEYHTDDAPQVAIQGLPVSKARFDGHMKELRLSFSDVPNTELGYLRASTKLVGLAIDPARLKAGTLDGAHAEEIISNVGLDAVALGKVLGITDLDISNPRDISPGAENSTTAQLLGTPPGFEDTVGVVADLSIDGTSLAITPTTVVEGTDTDRILAAFSARIDTTTLPMPKPADNVYLSGGTIIAEVTQVDAEVDTTTLL